MIKKIRIEFLNITFISEIKLKYVHSDDSNFYTKNPYNEDVNFQVRSFMKNKENLETKEE